MTDQLSRPRAFQHVPEWIANAAINADYTSSALDCRGRNRLAFHFVIASTSDPIGNLYIQGSIDGSNFASVKIEDGKMYTSDSVAITHTSADLTKIVVNDPAAAASVLVEFEAPFPYMRFFYDRTSGGSATGLDVAYSME